MTLGEFLKTHTQTELSIAIGVSPGMISLWVTGRKAVTPARCVAIENATNGQVTRKELRPADWHLIWPELNDPPKKTTISKPSRKEWK